MKKKKTAVIICLLLLIAAAGGAGFYYREQLMDLIPFLRGANSQDKVYVQKVSRIMNRSTGTSNRYNGIVETQETYEVNVDSSRTIAEILVKVGDTVEEGQELVAYDTSDIDLQIKQAQLEKEGINNEIANYNKQIEALKKERDAVTDGGDTFSYTTEIQSLENSIEQSRFDLDSKQLEIDKLREQLSKSTVVSKQSGVVKEINENGTNSNGDSAAFMTILKKGDYRVKGSIDEQSVWMVSEGQPVVIRSRVEKDKIWRGSITKVDTDNTQSSGDNNYGASDSSESATKYPFYIELESVEGLLLGQHVYIETDEGQEEEKEGLWLFASYVVLEGSENQTPGESVNMGGEWDTELSGPADGFSGESGFGDAGESAETQRGGWGMGSLELSGNGGDADDPEADAEPADEDSMDPGDSMDPEDSMDLGEAADPEEAVESLSGMGDTEGLMSWGDDTEAEDDFSGPTGGFGDAPSGEAYVWVANEKNRLEKRYVELGRYDAALDEYEILSGLTEDDYVAWPMPGLYEGITTVTSEDEVDYSSPLYNPESTEDFSDFEGDFEGDFESMDPAFTDMEYGTETYDLYDTGMDATEYDSDDDSGEEYEAVDLYDTEEDE